MASVDDPERLAALEASGLLDRSTQWRLDTLCHTAAELLRVPVAMVNILLPGVQHSIGVYPADMERTMRFEDTGCRHVLEADAMISIPNTLLHPVMCISPLTTTVGIRAYLGLPIKYENHTVGTFCVLDYVVREWSHWDIEGLKTLAKTAGLAVDT